MVLISLRHFDRRSMYGEMFLFDLVWNNLLYQLSLAQLAIVDPLFAMETNFHLLLLVCTSCLISIQLFNSLHFLQQHYFIPTAWIYAS